MSDGNHTPGPWQIYHHVSPRKAHVCWAVGSEESGLMGIGHCLRSKEDALLIAAAPDLLTALKAAINFIATTKDYKIGHTGAHNIFNEGQAAIRKVGGGV